MKANHNQTMASWILGSLSFLVLVYVMIVPGAITSANQAVVFVFCAAMGGFFTIFFSGTITGRFISNDVGKTIISATGGIAVFTMVFLGLLHHYPSPDTTMANSPSASTPTNQPSRLNAVTSPVSRVPISSTGNGPNATGTKEIVLHLKLRMPLLLESGEWILLQTTNVWVIDKVSHDETREHSAQVSVKTESYGVALLNLIDKEETVFEAGSKKYSVSLVELTADDGATIRIKSK